MARIPIKDLIRTYGLASVGKLMSGLIHNINGPLHNLGMGIEMMELVLSGDKPSDPASIENLKDRLKRIEEEFEHIAQLVRTTSARANLGDEYHVYINFHDFLSQELSFLKGNLYFKHQVKTELKNKGAAPLLGDLPENFGPAFGWFLQDVIEKLEHQETHRLTIKTNSSSSGITVTIHTERKSLSDDFMRLLNHEDFDEDNQFRGDKYLGIKLALSVFKSGGISIKADNSSSESSIILTVPISKHNGD